MSADSTSPPPEKPVGGVTQDDRTWGLLAHLSALIAYALGGLTPLGPLVVWLLMKDQSTFVAEHAKEALNFQITVLLATVICGVTCVGILLWPVIIVGNFVLSIMAAMEANKGATYRYPYCLRLIT